jgi:hypothetical protein
VGCRQTLVSLALIVARRDHAVAAERFIELLGLVGRRDVAVLAAAGQGLLGGLEKVAGLGNDGACVPS